MSLHTLGGRGGHCWLCSSLQPCFACSGQSCWAWTPNRTLFLVLVYTQDARGNGGTVGAKLCGHKGDFSASLEGVKVRSWQRNSAGAFRCWAGRGAGSGVSFCSFNSQPRVWNVVILNKNRHLNSWDYCKAVATLLWWVTGVYRVLFPWVTEIPVKFLWSLCYESVFIYCFFVVYSENIDWSASREWQLFNAYLLHFFLGQAPAIEVSDQNAAAASAFRKWSWNWISEEFQAFASPFFSELLLKDMSDALGMAWVCKSCHCAIPAQAVQLTHTEIWISGLWDVGSQELTHRPSLRSQEMKPKDFCEIFMFLTYFCIWEWSKALKYLKYRVGFFFILLCSSTILSVRLFSGKEKKVFSYSPIYKNESMWL